MEEVFKALDDLEGCAEGIEVESYYDILYQALTELKAIKEAKPSEALKSLEEMYILCTPQRTYYKLDKCNNIIKKSLLKAQEQEKENAEYKKVLEIIKEKNVNMFNLKLAIDNNSLRLYNNTISNAFKHLKLTQEEFDLLKRWYNNGKRI